MSVEPTTEGQSAPDDYELIRATQLAKVAAATMAGASVMGIVVALQGLAILQLRGVFQLSEPVFAVLGTAGIVAAKRLAAMRHQGAVMVMVVGGALALAALAWFVVAAASGLFVFIPLLLVPLSGVAAGLGVANLSATARADEARKRLQEQGLDAGLGGAPAMPPRARRLLLLSLGAVCLVGAAAVGAWLALRPQSPLETKAGKLLSKALPELVLALSQGNRSRIAAAEDELTGSRAQKAVGDAGVAGLKRTITSMHAVVAAPEPREAIEAYQRSVTELDKTLETGRVPFFLDAELHFAPEPQPLLMTYYVQRDAHARVGQSVHRVVRLWRADDIGITQGLLGFTRPHTPAAIVLLDQVESDLVQFTLPAAAPMGVVELVDEETRGRGEPWALELEERASKAILAHYRSLGGELSGDAVRIGTLLSRRRSLVRKWAALLRGQGRELAVPHQIFPKVDYAEQLKLRIPHADLDEWTDLHDELRARLPGFERLRDRFVTGVERHELQHRIDYARGLIPIPPILCRVLAIENPLDAAYGSMPARARDEASAYLAEVARPEDSPLQELVILSHFVVDRHELGGPYSLAAIEVYGAIAKALGVDVENLLAPPITRERFARLAEIVWEHGPAEIRAAARQAYAAELGAELPDIKYEAPIENQRYRPDEF